MARAPGMASAVALGFLVQAVTHGPPATLLTVPLRDRWQSIAGPSSVGVSADGRYIAFASYAPLVPADVNDRADIYVLDRLSGGVTLESPPADSSVQGHSMHPRLSGDGRYLVFQTAVPAADGISIAVDIVLRDRMRDSAMWVSGRGPGRLPNGSSRNAAISDDGRVVAFQSDATNLLAGPDENGFMEDIYVFEPATAILRRVSVDNSGVQRADGSSFAPDVSADGRYVAFTSTADLDLSQRRHTQTGPAKECTVPSCPAITRVYVRDLQLGLTRAASVDPRGQHPDDSSSDPAISRDGRYVAFTSLATNLIPGDRNRLPDVFVRDMTAGSTTLISRSATGGTANGSSSKPAISADGRFVAFQSDASNLICARRCSAALDDINLLSDVFLFDRETGRASLISGQTTGGWIEESGLPRIDAAGRIVAFLSRHPIDEADMRNDFDLFVRVEGNQPASSVPRRRAERAETAQTQRRREAEDAQRVSR